MVMDGRSGGEACCSHAICSEALKHDFPAKDAFSGKVMHDMQVLRPDQSNGTH